MHSSRSIIRLASGSKSVGALTIIENRSNHTIAVSNIDLWKGLSMQSPLSTLLLSAATCPARLR